jgi:pilus assembly protein Flp/PilA
VVELLVSQATRLQMLVLDVLHRDEEGQDMIEYALLAALISIVAIVMILAIGPYIQNTFSDVANALASA